MQVQGEGKITGFNSSTLGKHGWSLFLGVTAPTGCNLYNPFPGEEKPCPWWIFLRLRLRAQLCMSAVLTASACVWGLIVWTSDPHLSMDRRVFSTMGREEGALPWFTIPAEDKTKYLGMPPSHTVLIRQVFVSLWGCNCDKNVPSSFSAVSNYFCG